MRLPAASALCLLVAACGTTYEVPTAGRHGVGAGDGRDGSPAPAGPRVISRGVACAGRANGRGLRPRRGAAGPPSYRDFRVLLETDPRMPPNAFQTPAKTAAGGRRQLASPRRDAVRRRARLRPQPRDGATRLPATSASSSSSRPSAHSSWAGSRRRGQRLRRRCLRRRDRAGDERRRLRRGACLFAELRARGRHPRHLHTARAGYSPERAPTSSAGRRSPTPGARRSSRAIRASAQRQAVVAQVAAEVRRQQALGLAPDPVQRRPRDDRGELMKIFRRHLRFGGCESPGRPLDIGSPKRTVPRTKALTRRGKPAARCGTRQIKDAKPAMLSVAL